MQASRIIDYIGMCRSASVKRRRLRLRRLDRHWARPSGRFDWLQNLQDTTCFFADPWAAIAHGSAKSGAGRRILFSNQSNQPPAQGRWRREQTTPPCYSRIVIRLLADLKISAEMLNYWTTIEGAQGPLGIACQTSCGSIEKGDGGYFYAGVV